MITWRDKRPRCNGLKDSDAGNITDLLANLTNGLVLECVRQINLYTTRQMNKLCSDWLIWCDPKLSVHNSHIFFAFWDFSSSADQMCWSWQSLSTTSGGQAANHKESHTFYRQVLHFCHVENRFSSPTLSEFSLTLFFYLLQQMCDDTTPPTPCCRSGRKSPVFFLVLLSHPLGDETWAEGAHSMA